MLHPDVLNAVKPGVLIRARLAATFRCMLSCQLSRPVAGCVCSTQRVGHIMANLQRRTSHIAITYLLFSVVLLWFINDSKCSSYIEVPLPPHPPGPGVRACAHAHPCNNSPANRKLALILYG